MLFPVLIGGGKRLFPDSPEKQSLKLVETTGFDSGVHSYRPPGRG